MRLCDERMCQLVADIADRTAEVDSSSACMGDGKSMAQPTSLPSPNRHPQRLILWESGITRPAASLCVDMNRLIIGTLLGAAFFGALIYTTIDQTGLECRVCITYMGQTACETAAGADRAQVQMQATTTACTYMSSGVTESMRCTRTPPDSVVCTE